MHKLISFIFLILFFSSYSYSQSTIFIGAKGGLINSGFLGNDADGYEKKAGITAGIFFNYTNENGFFGLQPEVQYAQKGATYINAFTRDEYRFDYAEVPILFKISIPIKIISPKLLIGPYAAFKVHEEVKRTNLITNEVEILPNDKSGFDFGAVGGAGLDVKLGPILIMGDVRYNMGFKEIGQTQNLEEIKNGNFSVNVGLGFKF